MSQELIREVAEVNNGKRYLLLGSDGKDKNIVMDMSSTVVTVLPKLALTAVSEQIANISVVPHGFETTDISNSRLGVIAEGGVSNFCYIIKRYKSVDDEAVGYLMYKFTNYTQVQLLKLPTQDALKAFEYGMVLNAKKVTVNGVEIISGIQHQIPVDSVVTTSTTGSKDVDTTREHTNYLDKLETKFERSIVSRGFAVKPTATKDGLKSIKRLLEERIKVKEPEIYAWYAKLPSTRRAIQAIDLYIVSGLQKRNAKDLHVYMSSTFAYTSLDAINYNAVKNCCLIVLKDNNTKVLNFPPLNLDYLTQDTVVLQANGFGVIAPSNLIDLKQLTDDYAENPVRGVNCMILNGTLMSDYDNLPVDEEIKYFFKKRDTTILEILSINVPKFTKPDTTTDDFKDALNINLKRALKHVKTTLFNKVKKIDIDGDVTGKGHYLLNLDDIDWSSDDAFIAMGYKPLKVDNINLTGTIPLNRFYGTITEDNWNSKTVNSRIFLENQEVPKNLITCVGDVILVYNFLGATTSPSGYEEVEEELLIKYIALLAMGNKVLAELMLSINKLSDYELNIDIKNVAKVEDYTGSVYKTGGRLGDTDIFNTVGIIPFFRNGGLSEEFQSKLATAISILTEEPLERVKNLYNLGDIYYTRYKNPFS